MTVWNERLRQGVTLEKAKLKEKIATGSALRWPLTQLVQCCIMVVYVWS